MEPFLTLTTYDINIDLKGLTILVLSFSGFIELGFLPLHYQFIIEFTDCIYTTGLKSTLAQGRIEGCPPGQ